MDNKHFKYGLFFHVFYSEITSESLSLLEKAKNGGFDGVEISVTPELLSSNKDILKELKNRSEDTGISCIFSTGLDQSNSVIAPEKDNRCEGINHLKACVDLVASFGGDVLGGILYGPWGDFTDAPRKKEQREWCKEALWEVAEYAKKSNVFLALEPVNRFESFFLNTAYEARQLIEEIGHSQIKMQLDTFQMNIDESDLGEAIRVAGDLLYHFHCCASHRGVPGTGHIDWIDVFKALKEVNYHRWLVIESFTPDFVNRPGGKKVAIWRELASPEDIAFRGLYFLRGIEQAVYAL